LLTLWVSLAAWRVLAAGGVPVPPPLAASAGATNPAVVLTHEAWRDLADLWDAAAGKPAGSPIENLTLPLEHHDNGRVRAVLHARTASITDERYIYVRGAVIELFTTEGVPDGRVEAECGLFDRASRRAYCRGAVSFTRHDARVSGVDMFWSAEQQRMRILSRGEVRAKGLIGPIGGVQ